MFRGEANFRKFLMVFFAATPVVRESERMMETCCSPELNAGIKIGENLGKSLFNIRGIIGVEADENKVCFCRIIALPGLFLE